MVSRVNAVLGILHHGVGINGKSGFRNHQVIDAVVVKRRAPVLIGGTCHRVFRAILHGVEVFGCGFLRFGILRRVKVAHNHRRVAAELLDFIEHDRNPVDARFVADVV